MELVNGICMELACELVALLGGVELVNGNSASWRLPFRLVTEGAGRCSEMADNFKRLYIIMFATMQRDVNLESV